MTSVVATAVDDDITTSFRSNGLRQKVRGGTDPFNSRSTVQNGTTHRPDRDVTMRTMKAAVIRGPGAPEVLRIEELPVPRPAPGWVLIRVKAFGLNRSELFTRQGHSPGVEFPRVLGIEAVGTVEKAPGGEFPRGQTVATAMGGMGPGIRRWLRRIHLCARRASAGARYHARLANPSCSARDDSNRLGFAQQLTEVGERPIIADSGRDHFCGPGGCRSRQETRRHRGRHDSQERS